MLCWLYVWIFSELDVPFLMAQPIKKSLNACYLIYSCSPKSNDIVNMQLVVFLMCNLSQRSEKLQVTLSCFTGYCTIYQDEMILVVSKMKEVEICFMLLMYPLAFFKCKPVWVGKGIKWLIRPHYCHLLLTGLGFMFLTQDNDLQCIGLGYKWFPNDRPAVNSRFALLVLLRS